jgi:hypothetical protein
MTYLGGFLMIGGMLAMGICFLGLALTLLDPFNGGMSLMLAVVVGVLGAQIMDKAEGGAL